RSRLPDRQRRQARRGGRRRGARLPRAPGARVDGTPQDQRRGHGANREERPERTEQRGEQTEREPARERPDVPTHLDRERRERGERTNEQGLGRQAEPGAGQASDEREGERLDQVRGEQHARAGPETFEDRDRRQLAPEERRDRRGDADPADEQARQPDQPEIGRELREESPKPGLRLVERRDSD